MENSRQARRRDVPLRSGQSLYKQTVPAVTVAISVSNSRLDGVADHKKLSPAMALLRFLLASKQSMTLAAQVVALGKKISRFLTT